MRGPGRPLGWALVLCYALLAGGPLGCRSTPPQAAARDARILDAAPRDAAGPGDAAAPDASDLDASGPDSAPPDATGDASAPDGARRDAQPLDAATVDAAPGDATTDRAPARYLALGDSYTIGERVAPGQRWPVQLANRLRTAGVPIDPPEIIARTGWDVGQLMRAVEAAAPAPDAALVSLLIGVNDQFRGGSAAAYQPAFRAALAQAIALAGDPCRVVVLSIPDYGFTPFGRGDQPRISAALDAFNAVNRSETLAAGARYVDIVAVSRQGLADPALVAADGLHPSGAQYAAWAEQAQPAAALALAGCPDR